MIQAYFGIEKNPFANDEITLLEQQQTILDTLKVHCYQGGLCLIMGEPGTGKSVLKEALKQQADKSTIIASISRTLHTYSNILKILCQTFGVDYAGNHFKCEKRLIEEAFNIKRDGKVLITIIDEAHLLEMETLRKIRLVFEDFPRNHNLILVGQSELMHKMNLKINEDIKTRITYSVSMKRLNPDDMREFIYNELDKVGLGHNTFNEEALELIIRSSEGTLRKARNLCLSCMLEALRSQTKRIGQEIVNKVLVQPHWRIEQDLTHI